MRKMLMIFTVTLPAAVMALLFAASADAGGPHFRLSASLPLPPLPPVPAPSGFVDVNVPAHSHGAGLHVTACGPAPYRAPVERHVYRRAYNARYAPVLRHAKRHVRRDIRHARRDFRHARRDMRHDLRHDIWCGVR